MKGFKINIEKETLGNSNFRKVLYTGRKMQLVLMNLKPGEDIGAEIHKLPTSSSVLSWAQGNALSMITNIQ
jgi:mannose-6-phosphate isomerase-like protein (cupin superfamily)